jgi:hypothetical protein
MEEKLYKFELMIAMTNSFMKKVIQQTITDLNQVLVYESGNNQTRF